MTIRIPKKNLGDRILATMGKNRAVFLPSNVANNYDARYLYSQARKEPFLKALLRSKNTRLPDGWVYIDELKMG